MSRELLFSGHGVYVYMYAGFRITRDMIEEF